MRLIIWLTIGNASNESITISCRVELEPTPQAKEAWICKVLIWDTIFRHFSSSCFQSQSSRQTFESHETVTHNVCKHLTCWNLACVTHGEGMGNLYSPILKFSIYNKIGIYVYSFKQKFFFLCFLAVWCLKGMGCNTLQGTQCCLLPACCYSANLLPICWLSPRLWICYSEFISPVTDGRR